MATIASCLRDKGNWTKLQDVHKFDHPKFDPKKVLDDMVIASPKMYALIQNIIKLDEEDKAHYGHTFKHFIYSDLRSSYGAKLLASGLTAFGFHHAYGLEQTPRGKSFVLKPSTANAFATLTTVNFFQKPVGIQFRKEILKRFNARPDNIYGEKLRIVILDSGLREGVDLFDVKYVHLFEPILTKNDEKQAIGRATRFCGQKGLEFDQGWALEVFRYDSESLLDLFLNYSQLDLKQLNFAKILEDVVISAAVDRSLTSAFRTQNGGGLLPDPKRIQQLRIIQARKEAAERSRKPFMEKRKQEEERLLRSYNERRERMLVELEKRRLLQEEYERTEARKALERKQYMEAKEAERLKLLKEAQEAAERERLRLQKEAEAERLKRLQEAREAAERERLRLQKEAEKAAEVERLRLQKEAEEAEADRLRRLKEAEEAAERERLRLLKEAEAERLRRLKEAEEAEAERLRLLKEAEEAAERERLRRLKEAEEAAERERLRLLKEAERAEKERLRKEAILRELAEKERTELMEMLERRKEMLRTPPPKNGTLKQLDHYVDVHFSDFTWSSLKMENGCLEPPSNSLDFSPTQNFIRHYLTPASPYHGLLAFHSVGTGKTCLAIATATTHFEPAGWTILYVTKTTLKGDVWKNMFDQVCSVILKKKVKEGFTIPEAKAARMKLLSKSWNQIQPLSYKQFSNMLKGKNSLATKLHQLNGKEDPLRKTLVIIDEAHKLFVSDMPPSERVDIKAVRNALQHSYKHSGKDSVKLLLMTGTPYTNQPMDMIQLLNLILDQERELPHTFTEFAKHYLDTEGKFTSEGQVEFMDHIAGLVSYLNRENDRRTFAYPVIHDWMIPLSKSEYKEIEASYQQNQEEIQRLEITLKELEADGSEFEKLQKAIEECQETSIKVKQCKKDAQKKYDKEMKAALKAGNTASLEKLTETLSKELKRCSEIGPEDCTPAKQALKDAKHKRKADTEELSKKIKAITKYTKELNKEQQTLNDKDMSQTQAIQECLKLEKEKKPKKIKD